MTAAQTINMYNPMNRLNKYTNVIIMTNEEIENIMIAVNPLKQKFLTAWNKTKKQIMNNLEFNYLYGKLTVNNFLNEIAEWNLTTIKKYVAAYIRKYSNNGWRLLHDKDAELEHKIKYTICRDFLYNYYPDICDVSVFCNQFCSFQNL